MDSLELPNPFHEPVGALAREVAVLDRADSIGRAAQAMLDYGSSLALVMDGSEFLGVITEESLMGAHSDGASYRSSIEPYISRDFRSLDAQELGSAALRSFADYGVAPLLVVDSRGKPIGTLHPSDLFPRPLTHPRPPLVGGMATPFGVYLTNGKLRAGAGDFALALTGSILFLLFFGSSLISEYLGRLAEKQWGSSLMLETLALDVLPLVIFLVGMRLMPLAGIHAAEHQVVHALERGEPLIPEVVSRMPRVHPRCGTNIAAAAALFLGLMNSTWIPDSELRLLIAALVTLIFWRRLGGLIQYLVTTKPPKQKHVMMGIRAAEELLEKYRLDRDRGSDPFMRIWASGMIHVMAGSLATYLLLAGIAYLFHLDLFM